MFGAPVLLAACVGCAIGILSLRGTWSSGTLSDCQAFAEERLEQEQSANDRLTALLVALFVATCVVGIMIVLLVAGLMFM
jgi:hypothetical protein